MECMEEKYHKLYYNIHSYSSFSSSYLPENIRDDSPTNQISRWSSDTNTPTQFITLRLSKPSIVKYIRFGKYEKPHVCNLKKFKVFAGMELNNLTQIFEGGLKNDSVPETFELKNETFGNAGSPTLFSNSSCVSFIKIVPLLSYGPSFNFSIWYIELLGIDDELIVNENLQKYNDQKEVLTIKYILKHLRNRGHMETFKCLVTESNVKLEDEDITELYNCLMERGDFEQVEIIMEKLIEDDKTYDEYALRQRYKAKLEEISIGEPRPRHNVDAAYCFDSSKRLLYMFGGFRKDQTELNEFWIYDLNFNKWTQFDNLNPSPRGGSRMVFDAVGNQIFLLGRKPVNKSENLKSDFYLFDVSKKSWMLIMPDTASENGPECIYDHQIVLSQELRTIFVSGGRLAKGYENSDCFSDFYTYHINSNTWTRIYVDCGHMMASNPDVLSIKSRANHSMLYDGEKMYIYILGGCRGKETFTDVLKINAKSKSITSIPTSAFDPDYSAAIVASYSSSTASIDEAKREIFFFSQESIWVYSLVTNEWKMICKNPMTTALTSFDYAVFDISSRKHLIVKQGQLLSLELKKPSKETVISTCKYLIRKQKYEEMVANDPITALHFLQNNLHETVSTTDIEQVDDFHKLASLVFSREKNLMSGESGKRSEEILRQRTCLFNKLIDVLPEEHCQPRKSLSNFIS